MDQRSGEQLFFVNREHELQRLHDALNSTILKRRPRFILIEGEFGTGKTVLVDRFLEEVAEKTPTFLIGRGKCAMETERNGLVPFQKILDGLLQQSVVHLMTTERLTEFFVEVLPAWVDAFTGGAFNDTAKAARRLLGQTKFSEQNIFVQLVHALSQLTESQPAIALLDDLQWADSSSLRLLFHIAQNLSDRAVLFLCVYRPEAMAPENNNADLFRKIRANLILRGDASTEIRLSGISVDRYVAARYPRNSFPQETISQIQHHTEGHAKFVHQLFSLWEDNGVIASVDTPGGNRLWRFAQKGRIRIPESLGAVVDERLGRLTKEFMEILHCASIEGEEFTAQVVAHLRQMADIIAVYGYLRVLEKQHSLVRQLDAAEQSRLAQGDFYKFAHRFFRDHIYQGLAPGERRAMHRCVGEYLETIYSNDLARISSQLAFHFQEAQEFSRAAVYALRAAEYEQSQYHWTEAEGFCKLGIDLFAKIKPVGQNPDLHLSLLETAAYSDFYAGKYAEAAKNYREALTLAKQISIEPERLAKMYNRLGDIAEYEGREASEILDSVETGIWLLESHSIVANETYIMLQGLKAFVLSREGKNSEAVLRLTQLVGEAEELPQSATLNHLRGELYNYLAITLGNMGRYSKAIAIYQKAVDQGEKGLAAICLVNMADECLKLGELEQGLANVERGMVLSQQLGDLENVAYARAVKGALLVTSGQAKEAVQELTSAIGASKALEAEWNMPYMYADLATAYLDLTELPLAYEAALRAVACAEQSSRSYELAYAIDALARVEAAQLKWVAAENHFRQAIQIHTEAEQIHGLTKTQIHYAQALYHRDNRLQALDLLHAGLAGFERLGLTKDVAETKQLITTIQAGL